MRLGGLQLALLAAIERMDGQAWTEPLVKETGAQHISKALVALRRKGLITRRWASNRPKRRYYRVTEEGKDVRKRAVEAANA